jgi:hypothetical protein
MQTLLYWDTFDTEHGWRKTTAPDAEGAVVTTLLGPEQSAAPFTEAIPQSAAPFTEAIPSWSAATPPGSWIEVQLRARREGRWTAFYRIAQWDSLREGSVRRSFDTQRDADGRVATDTLALAGPAEAIQPRLVLHYADEQPVIRALWVALSAPAERVGLRHDFTPRELLVPPRSQMAYPNGRNICSPTSVSMLLAYWHAQTGDARLAPFADPSAVSNLVAPQVYDPVYDGHGNWGFNTAFAAGFGLDAYVARLGGLDELERWIAAGVPVVISAAWASGELANAPIPSSNGHLLIVCGFDKRGQVIVADPRGERESEVRRVYDAGQLTAAWQRNSGGTVYLIYPHGWPTRT